MYVMLLPARAPGSGCYSGRYREKIVQWGGGQIPQGILQRVSQGGGDIRCGIRGARR